MAIFKKIIGSPYFLWLLLAMPLVSLASAYVGERIFYGETLHASGEFSARLLIITLAATPMRLVFPSARWSQWLVRNRRYFGVATFFYALLHTIVYVLKQESFMKIAADGLLFEMWTGWLALLLFLLLATTSNNVAMLRLGRTWKKLHRWVYVAALLTFAHWIFIAFNFVPGVVHLLILVALESVRVFKSRSVSVR